MRRPCHTHVAIVPSRRDIKPQGSARKSTVMTLSTSRLRAWPSCHMRLRACVSMWLCGLPNQMWRI